MNKRNLILDQHFYTNMLYEYGPWPLNRIHHNNHKIVMFPHLTFCSGKKKHTHNVIAKQNYAGHGEI